jgi:AraC-like DNA-binding protein
MNSEPGTAVGLGRATSESQMKAKSLRRLRELAEFDTRGARNSEEPALISAFVSHSREKVQELSTPVTGLVVVIEGHKEALVSAERQIYGPGDAFLVPAGARLTVVNEPDDITGVYRALFVRLSRDLIIEAARLWPNFNTGRPIAGSSVSLGPALASALTHAAEAIVGTPPVSRRVIEHRILEVILSLAEAGVLPLTPKYVDGSVADAVRLLVRHRLDRNWTSARVASELSMSEATLRRRLRKKGETLRSLLMAERMKAAHTILADRNADVADAIAATGYTSRSHFAFHFKQAFGVSPSHVRRYKDGAPKLPA